MSITHSVVTGRPNSLMYDVSAAAWNAAHTVSTGLISRSATLVVAASDSLDTSAADYVCDGTADEAEINTAMAALPAQGGVVILMEGTYTLADPISFPANSIELRGMGRCTFIDGDGLATTEHAITLSGRDYCAVRNLAVQTEDGGGKDSDCINVVDCLYLHIDGVTIVASDDDGISVESTSTNNTGLHITNCTFVQYDDDGIYMNRTAAVGGEHYTITGNTVLGASPGSYIFHLSYVTYFTIANNTINGGNTASYPIYLIYCTWGNVEHNVCEDYGYQGIYLALSNSKITVSGNILYANGGTEGINLRPGHSNYCSAIDNIIDRPTQYGIQCGDYTTVTGNVIYQPTRDGILASAADHAVIADNVIIDPDVANASTYMGINLNSSCLDCVVTGNTISGGDLHGIYVAGSRHTITGNSCISNDGHGIYLDDADDSVISGNMSYDNDAANSATYDGIYVDADSTDNLLIGNNCYANDRNGIQSDGDRNSIIGNFCNENGDYGIEIAATADANLVKNNYLYNNTVGVFLDGGTNTRLDSVPFQFIKELVGVYLTTSPTGIEIDANTEGAILQGRIPIPVQQVVRIRIDAVALAAPVNAGGQMHLEITFNAGANNAAYNTAAKSWTLANHDSEEADYVNGDVVSWIIEDGDVGNELLALAAGDKFEMIVTHESSADPDGETDAVFGSIIMEYV